MFSRSRGVFSAQSAILDSVCGHLLASQRAEEGDRTRSKGKQDQQPPRCQSRADQLAILTPSLLTTVGPILSKSEYDSPFTSSVTCSSSEGAGRASCGLVEGDEGATTSFACSVV